MQPDRYALRVPFSGSKRIAADKTRCPGIRHQRGV